MRTVFRCYAAEVFRTLRLQRYVFIDCVTFFLLALSAFTGVLLTVQLLRLSDLVVNRGVAGADIAMMFVAVVPTFLELAIPMAAVVGVMLAVARLSSDAELIVMRASGVSLYQLVPAVVAFGLALALAGLMVAQFLKPWGYRTVSELLFKIAQDRTTAGLEAGVFNKIGLITLYPEQIDYRTGELTRVLLDQRQEGVGRRVFFAQRGRMQSNPATRSLLLQLEDGEIHEQAPTLQTSSVRDGGATSGSRAGEERSYSVTRFSSNSIDIGPEMLGPQEQSEEAPVRSLTSSKLRESQQWYRDAKRDISGFGPHGFPLQGDYRVWYGEKSKRELDKRTTRIDTELELRWAAPFAAFVLALVAFPLGVQPPRGQSSWGSGASLGVGITLFLVYYGLFSLGFGLAENKTVSATVAVWIPNIVALTVAVFLNRAVCSERVSSVGEVLVNLSLAIPAPRKLLAKSFRRASAGGDRK